MKKSRVFVDGALIGLVDDPKALVANIRSMRRQGALSPEVNVSHKEYNGDVVILTDRGRARRPLIVLKNGEPLITDEDLRNSAKEIDMSWFVQRGMIEFIDAEEEEDLFIAMDFSKLTPEHTHLEIDPSLILGIGAAHVPFPEHNASPRVTMGAGMVKQALGFGAANMNCAGHPGPPAPLCAETAHPHPDLGTDRVGRPAGGQNFVVAILSYEGYNIEDALIFNKASIERGLGRSHFFRTYEGEERRYPGGQIDRIEVPDEDVAGAHGADAYKNLDEDGVINPETVVAEKDALIGKTSPPRFLEEPSGELHCR